VINLDEFALKKGHGNFALVISAPEEGYVLDVLSNRERINARKVAGWAVGGATQGDQSGQCGHVGTLYVGNQS